MKMGVPPSSGVKVFLPLGDEDGRSSLVGREGVLAVALALEGSGQYLSLVVELIMSLFRFGQESVFCHFLYDVVAEHFQRVCSQLQPGEQLFQAECLCRP